MSDVIQNDAGTTGQTGALSPREDSETHSIDDSGASTPPFLPADTGLFSQVPKEPKVKLDDDPIGEVPSLQLLLNDLLFAEDQIQTRRSVVQLCILCESLAELSNFSESEMVSYIFSSIVESPFLKLDEVNSEVITREYYKKAKLIIKTIVEYLCFVRGVDWYKLKVFLSFYNIQIESIYNTEDMLELDQNRRAINFLNKFIPNIFALLKEKSEEHLSYFVSDLIRIMEEVSSRAKYNIGLGERVGQEEFLKQINDFCNNFLDVELRDFFKILNEIYLELQKDPVLNESYLDETKRISFFTKKALTSGLIHESMDGVIDTVTGSYRRNNLRYFYELVNYKDTFRYLDFGLNSKDLLLERMNSIYPLQIFLENKPLSREGVVNAIIQGSKATIELHKQAKIELVFLKLCYESVQNHEQRHLLYSARVEDILEQLSYMPNLDKNLMSMVHHIINTIPINAKDQSTVKESNHMERIAMVFARYFKLHPKLETCAITYLNMVIENGKGYDLEMPAFISQVEEWKNNFYNLRWLLKVYFSKDHYGQVDKKTTEVFES